MAQRDCRDGCKCRRARPNCRVSRRKWDKPCQCDGYHYPHRVGSKLCHLDNKRHVRLRNEALNALAYGPEPEKKTG